MLESSRKIPAASGLRSTLDTAMSHFRVSFHLMRMVTVMHKRAEIYLLYIRESFTEDTEAPRVPEKPVRGDLQTDSTVQIGTDRDEPSENGLRILIPAS